MAAPNRFAIREAAEATFWSLTTEKPIVTLRTLKTNGVETTGETVYARGGRGNSKLVGFSSNREARLNLEDAIFDVEALAMLTGNTVTAGAKNISWNEIVTVTTNAATLTKTPVGALLGLYKVNADGTNGTEITKKGEGALATGQYEITTKAITFFAGDHVDTTKIRAYYTVATDATAKTIKVTSDAFGGTFKVTLECLVRDEFTKKDYEAQLIVHNAKFEDNFNLEMSAEGDPAVVTLPMEVLKDPLSTDMWELVVYDQDLVV